MAPFSSLLDRGSIRTAIVALFLLLFVSFPVVLNAAEGDAPPSASGPGSFPGLQEVIPRASQLTDDLAQMNLGVAINVDIKSLLDQTDKLERDWQTFSAQVTNFGEFDSWPVNRLLQAQTQVEQHNRDFGQLLEQVSEPLSAFEDIRVIWTAKRTFWVNWGKTLRADKVTIPRGVFQKVDAAIAEMLQASDEKVTLLVQLQQRISKGRDDVLKLREMLNSEMADLRRDPFKRNDHPLLTIDFFQQIDNTIWNRAVEGIKATVQFQGDFFSRQWWLITLQIGMVLLLTWLIHLLKQVSANRAEGWEFIFQHPISTAILISTTLPSMFYVAPPPALLFLVTAFAVVSAARLASALSMDDAERRYVYLLATVYILNGTMDVSAAPLQVERLYLSLLGVFGIPTLILALRNRLEQIEVMDRTVAGMLLGIVTLLIVLITQLTGYVTLANRIIEAAFGTLIILLLATMMLRVGEGAIEFLFSTKWIRNKQFIRELGNQAPRRFKNLVRILVFVIALRYLLEAWGLGEGFENIWNVILGLHFSAGEFSLSVKMILLVAVVLYLSILTSWFFQAFMESQFFHNRRIDRGVRDAIKKLTHYALVLIGFLVALSMAGIDLQNFTILAGAFGIGIGFGLQDIVNNFISGLILLFERPVKIGDAVVVGDTWGIIRNIGLRSTVVETWDQSEIIVPNSQMISEKVTNWTLSSSVTRLVIPVGVKYGTDMKQVLQILEEVAGKHSEVVKEPKPSAIFTEFGDSSLHFELRVWMTDIMARFRVRSDLGVAIADAFHAADIEIPFPQRDLHLRSVDPGIMSSGFNEATAKKTTPHNKVVPKKKKMPE